MPCGGTPVAARIERISRSDVGGRALIAGAGRQIDDDAAGGLVAPGWREREHLGALRRRQLAAIGADEKFEGAIAFLAS